MYRAVLFDLDGTLTDTLQDIADAMNRALRLHGLEEWPVGAYRYLVGNGARILAQRCVRERQELAEAVRQTYQAYYETHNLVQTRPYEGIPELLAEFKRRGIKMGVVSNKPDAAAKEIVASFFGRDLIDLVTGQIDGVPHKPDPAAVLRQLGIQGMLHGMIVDGALSGVSAVLGFLPALLILFGLLSLLEDSGAMARMAFLMDPLLRRAGLSGRCFIPLMLGFGCSVPAVMSTRTLPSSRERNLTILMIPFIPCSAKAPVCAMLVQLLPAAYRFPTMAGLYGLGIGAAVFSAWLQNRLSPAKEVPFVLELPRYRLPSLRSVLCQLWQRVRDFLARAFGVILLSSVAIWFLQTFTLRLTPAPCLSDSMLGMMAAWLAHLFAPAGFGSLEASAALIAGLIAKENIAGVLGVLAGETPVFPTALSAFSFLVFAVLYAPCAAAFAAIRREAGTTYALLNALYQTTLAWLSAVLIFQLGRMAGL